MEVDLKLIRRGLRKIAKSGNAEAARATADLLMCYIDSIEGTPFEELGPDLVVEDNGLVTVRCKYDGPQKIQAIKELRTIGNYGLKEAKDFVEGCAAISMPYPRAKKIQLVFGGLGANVEIDQDSPF